MTTAIMTNQFNLPSLIDRAIEHGKNHLRPHDVENVIEFLRFCLKDPQAQLELVERLLRQYDKKIIKDDAFKGLMLHHYRSLEQYFNKF